MDEDELFEEEVRRIAGELWPSSRGGAANIDNAERDGLFITEEMVHLLEATTSRKKEKAEKDVEKIRKALPRLQRQHPEKGIKGWFITKDPPTSDQQDVVKKQHPSIVAESIHQFRAKLIDARDYLELRQRYMFGSAQHPETQSQTVLPEYIPLDLLEAKTSETWSVDRLAKATGEGKRVVLLGDFGAGKSMTLRQLFLTMTVPFINSDTYRFPVHLNLREHHGQLDTAEALERHARHIGMNHPAHVVRAWRSGVVDLILDGFDELASPGWTAGSKRLGAVRYSAMTLVRKFIQEAPAGSAVVLAGREHFFDSRLEMQSSLGLTSDFAFLTLNEFTEAQIAQLLAYRGLGDRIPSWMPARPLLVGYLAARGFLADAIALGDTLTPAESWDALIDRISEREAMIDVTLDGVSVRMIIERLSTLARTTADGLGPLTMTEMVAVFGVVCGSPPDDKGGVLLQRLPGLGLRDSSQDTRQFIDEQFVDAARAGDVGRFIAQPYSDSTFGANWNIPLGDLGVDVLVTRIKRGHLPAAGVVVALREAQSRVGCGVLAADLARICIAGEIPVAGGSGVFVREAEIPGIELDETSADLSGLEFQDCIVHVLELDSAVVPERMPRFVRCVIGSIEGRVGAADLPKGCFIDCETEAFGGSAATTAGIMELDLPPGARVALSILKKLHLQPGAGRKEQALSRGLDQASRRLVTDVLQLIEQHGLAVQARSGGQVIWQPVRSEGSRVHRILTAPMASSDPLIEDCERL